MVSCFQRRFTTISIRRNRPPKPPKLSRSDTSSLTFVSNLKRLTAVNPHLAEDLLITKIVDLLHSDLTLRGITLTTQTILDKNLITAFRASQLSGLLQIYAKSTHRHKLFMERCLD